MTLLKRDWKINGGLLASSSSTYAIWRNRQSAPASLREALRSAPPERLLQAVWFHQRLKREHLRTTDGRSLRVLHPGFWNHEAGPDFRQAVLQIGGQNVQGDVEVDLEAANWSSHGHDRNRAFGSVILHVIWQQPASLSASSLPRLVLEPFLDDPLETIQRWLGTNAISSLPAALTGKCSAPLAQLPEEKLLALLKQAALVRLENKAVFFLSRARQANWEQALWEGLLGALGYKQNVWPMRRLGELLPRLEKGRSLSPLHWQALLFGVGGLLPGELTARSPAHLRRCWDVWWRERDELAGEVLPLTVWHFNSLRPANRPERRLALAAHWLAQGTLPMRLKKWIATDIEKHDLPDSLLEICQAAPDEFWSWHLTLKSRRLSRPLPLLGTARTTDLAMNVILPWLWMQARAGSNAALQRQVELRYCEWPPAEDNAVLRLARQRLLASRSARILRTAATQQGLLQIVRDFCQHSNSLCEQCPFPELARSFLIKPLAEG